MSMQMITTRAFQRVVWMGVEMHLRGRDRRREQRSVFDELFEYRTRYGDIFRELIARRRARTAISISTISASPTS